MKKVNAAAGACMLALSIALILCLAAVETIRDKNRALEEQRYREEHSLFENISFCGTEASGGILLSERRGGSGASSSQEPESGARGAGSLAAGQSVRLINRSEGKWSAYIPADLAGSVRVSFDWFSILELVPAEGEERAEGLRLRSGDRIRFAPGSVWTARLIGRDGETKEEGRIVFMAARDVPTLYLTTGSGSMDAVNEDKTYREEGSYVFYREDGTKDASGTCRIHGRGNSSWKEDKKQYSLNLDDGRAVLGMESAKKFALVANHSDSSNLRNKTAYDLAGLVGLPSSPESRFVNVYFNGSYNGLYLLAVRPNARGGCVRITDLEKKNRELQELEGSGSAPAGKDASEKASGTAAADGEKDGNKAEAGQEKSSVVTLVDEEGLEIHASSQEALPDNISGGYLLEMDARYEEEDYWFSTQRHHFVVKSPDAIPLREAQYIASYVREAEKAIYSGDGINPDTGKSWDQYLDRDSWAKMYLLQDFAVQWDVESFSFFIYKEADDPLLYCGPAWDFDLSMGLSGLGRIPNISVRSMWLRDHREGWLTQLEGHDGFSEALETCAKKLFYPALETYLGISQDGDAEKAEDDKAGRTREKLAEGFASLAGRLVSSAEMDSHRWKEDDQFEESAQKLCQWLRARMRFLQDYGEDPEAFCTVTFRYGFGDMDVYVRRGEAIGFVPVEEYGEHLYGSFRRKYGEIDGWKDPDGRILTEDTVIDADRVYVPFEESGE